MVENLCNLLQKIACNCSPEERIWVQQIRKVSKIVKESKKVWIVKYYGWRGPHYETYDEESGITTYHPGTEYGCFPMRGVKPFNSPGEADEWLTNLIRENHLCCDDYTISCETAK